MSSGGDSDLSSSGSRDIPSLFRQLVGTSVSDSAVQSISEHFSSLNPSDEGLDLYSKLPPVGDPQRHEKLLDLLFADVAIRRHLGTDLSVHQYLRRYPELKREEVLDAMEAVGGKPGPPLSNIHDSAPKHGANSALRPVGEYKLVELLGAGGFGEVWLAEAPGGVPVAVKIIKRPIDDYTARQEHQALVLVKGLSHPCLVQTQAYWVLDDRLVIAMELCEQNLRQRLKQCQEQGLPGVPKRELLGCFRSAAEALDHLHKHKVHHRDIKPENLLLHHGHLKIADFGLAFLYDGEASMMTAPEAGTGRYMAPEVWNRKLSKHSDQYSLALAYAELRLGRPIITGKGTVEFMKQHLEKEPDLTGLPMDEADAVRQALAKDPHERFESCTAFIEALEATEPKEVKRGNRWLAPALGVAFVAVLGAYVYDRWGRTPRLVTVDIGPKVPAGATPITQMPVKDADGRSWYKTVRISKAGVDIPFVFIPPAGGGLKPFYMSQTKVTNRVVKVAYADPEFQALLAKWKNVVGPKLQAACFPWRWNPAGPDNEKAAVGGEDDERPAMNLTAAEAAAVAEWLGGYLPTPEQWNAAAGIDTGNLAPFQLPMEKVARSLAEGPAKVKAFSEDLSVHGVFDVAGNGQEWTRSFTQGEGSSIHDPNEVKRIAGQPSGTDALVLLRGFSFATAMPTHTVLNRVKQKLFGAHPWTDPQEDIGFRVVIELP